MRGNLGGDAGRRLVEQFGVGLMRGLGREVMSVIVWLTAFFASLALATPVANLFDLGESAGGVGGATNEEFGPFG